MAVPKIYANNFVSIKHMLSSYRALSDGRAGVSHLDNMLSEAQFLFAEWKVVWAGTCATLRTAVELFKIDARSCLSNELRSEILTEWRSIKENREDHAIFWKFLRAERNNIMHEYKWNAYEAWMKPDGSFQSPPSLLTLALDRGNAAPALLMRGGHYEGQDSLELLKDSAKWIEERIFSAIVRAGYEPDEKRSVWDFRPMPKRSVEQVGWLALPTEQPKSKNKLPQ